MDWQERMNRAMAWIEAHLEEDLDWTEAAREACCSPFHFLRMFEMVLGMTVVEYVRRRRLSRAADKLCARTSARVIDLALECGYESPDAFTRAFRRLFGCTPTEARRPGKVLQAFPPITFTIVLKGDVAMNYRIEKRDAFTLLGPWIRVKSLPEEENYVVIPEFWKRIMSDGTCDRLWTQVPPGSCIGICGVCAEYDPATQDFTYLAAVEMPKDRSGLPQDWKEVQVPAATWGVFESRGPLPQALQDTWKRVFTEWFPSSTWECAEGPQLEIYHPGDPSSPDYRSEVWIPLKPGS